QNRPAGPLGGFTRSAPHHSQGSIGVGTVGPPVGNPALRLLLPARVAARRCLGPATGDVGTTPRTEPRSARWPPTRVALAAYLVAVLAQDRRILRQWLTAGDAPTGLVPLSRSLIPVAHAITSSVELNSASTPRRRFYVVVVDLNNVVLEDRKSTRLN